MDDKKRWTTKDAVKMAFLLLGLVIIGGLAVFVLLVPIVAALWK